MSKKFIANSIGLGAFAVIIALVTIVPGLRSSSVGTGNAGDGPQLVGQMRHFILAKTQLPQPDIAWKDANGRAITLSNFDGKVVLSNYWASWCEVCTRELPSIDRLQAKAAA